MLLSIKKLKSFSIEIDLLSKNWLKYERHLCEKVVTLSIILGNLLYFMSKSLPFLNDNQSDYETVFNIKTLSSFEKLSHSSGKK